VSDRELLELAAKAAGIADAIWSDKFDSLLLSPGREFWNPLTDDGDALRLAVKVGLDVCIDAPRDAAPFTKVAGYLCLPKIPLEIVHIDEPHDDDPYAATRRAIVRAAAEIGRNMT
jgi:hypothetical protein